MSRFKIIAGMAALGSIVSLVRGSDILQGVAKGAAVGVGIVTVQMILDAFEELSIKGKLPKELSALSSAELRDIAQRVADVVNSRS